MGQMCQSLSCLNCLPAAIKAIMTLTTLAPPAPGVKWSLNGVVPLRVLHLPGHCLIALKVLMTKMLCSAICSDICSSRHLQKTASVSGNGSKTLTRTNPRLILMTVQTRCLNWTRLCMMGSSPFFNALNLYFQHTHLPLTKAF